MLKTFISSPNKDIVRKIDKEFIKDEYEFHRNKLRYFGLPSENLYDILEWLDYLEDFTAVERGHKSNPAAIQNLLICKAMQLGLYVKLTLLRGEIHDIILNDKDDVGQKIPYKFEIINLDYGGSVLHPDRMRIDALDVLISRQKPIDFLMFITTNIIEYDSEEIIKTQKRILFDIISINKKLETQITNYFDWINEHQSPLRQIIHLHYLIKYMAEQKGYNIICYPAIKYEGSKNTPMLRYIFRFRYVPLASTRVPSQQTLIEILNQKSQELIDQSLKDLEHPPEIVQ